MAVMDACEKLSKRLAPIKEQNPQDGWNQWVLKAYLDRVSLSATGFYKTPDIGYNNETNQGMAFNYFTYGAACSEVEIDCLTGDHQVIRTDIVMDLGSSLNPAIDIGKWEKFDFLSETNFYFRHLSTFIFPKVKLKADLCRAMDYSLSRKCFFRRQEMCTHEVLVSMRS